MNTHLAKQLNQNIRDFYENQGDWFATTRDKIMPEHTFVKDYVQADMTVVDVGAGNGRLAKLLPQNVTYLGLEPSKKLREAFEAPSPTFQLIDGALPSLPLSDKSADVTTCLAVLHHIPTQKTRRESIEELLRITKTGGTILATSWLRNPHHSNTAAIPDGELGDTWMPWTAPDGHTCQRFVHFMQPGEWQALWTHPALEIIRIGMHGKATWTEKPAEALNWRVIAKRR